MVTLGALLETMAKINRKGLSPRIAFIHWTVSCCQLSWGLKLWVWNILHVWQGCLSLESKVIFSTREIFHERVLSFDLSGVLSHLKRLCKLFLLTLSSVSAQIYTFDPKTCSYILIFRFRQSPTLNRIPPYENLEMYFLRTPPCHKKWNMDKKATQNSPNS